MFGVVTGGVVTGDVTGGLVTGGLVTGGLVAGGRVEGTVVAGFVATGTLLCGGSVDGAAVGGGLVAAGPEEPACVVVVAAGDFFGGAFVEVFVDKAATAIPAISNTTTIGKRIRDHNGHVRSGRRGPCSPSVTCAAGRIAVGSSA